ncbi:MAG: hypothetical protein EAZ76_04645 [Nostocales cyanobacterium]|nr:MAG: hypothetical protein EAZ87_08030 [Nostocales cyanobacterium]TAF18620.1 MAG: hypothetical protein EAZ76_04645 [Nostocales cyanobacterium]
MNQHKTKDILGKKFSQQSLIQMLDNSRAGQPLLPKTLLVVLMILFITISAFFVASLSYIVILNILIPSHYEKSVSLSALNSNLELKSWIIVSVAFIAIILLTVTTILQNIAQGLKITILFFGIFFSLSMIFRWLDTTYIIVTLFINLICLILFIVSFLSVGLFFKLNYVLNQKKYLIFYNLLYLSISYISIDAIFNLRLLDNPQTIYLRDKGILPNYILLYILVGDTLFSLFILILSYLATHYKNNFNFFHTWALTIGTWGGTSFYNLDLSNVNFQNSQLHNTDLRAKKLYRTCFQEVKGLETARVDNRYLDLDIPKVKKLLTTVEYSQEYQDKDFSNLNLRGAFLQGADLRNLNFTDTDLTGADLTDAKLQGAIFIRTKVIDVNFTRADLTGTCIKDWSYNHETDFTEVKCQYYYRDINYEGKPINKYPGHKNFEEREFESLYQDVEEVIELIFKEGENWQTTLFSIKKLQFEDENLGIELKGLEKKGDYWVVKVTYNPQYLKPEVEKILNNTIDELKLQLADKAQEFKQLEQRIDKLVDISHHQAEAIKTLSKKFGNSFLIVGSKITNLAGKGNIEYQEASAQIRNLMTSTDTADQNHDLVQKLLSELKNEGVVAPTTQTQVELIQEIIITEANQKTDFKQALLENQENILNMITESTVKKAIENAINSLSTSD